MISFGLKKQAVTKLSSTTSEESSKVRSLFDQSSGPVDESIQSRSLITSLDSSGFEGKITQSQKQIKPIVCRTLLPEQKKNGQLHEIVEIVPHREKRRRAENAGKETDNHQSIKDLMNSESFGLLGGKNDAEEENEEDLGPPSKIRATERDMKPLIEAHRGVVSSLGQGKNSRIDSETDYDEVPVEHFGLAMLMGMGYVPTKDKNEPLEVKRRVYTKAGLGADKAFEEDRKKAVTSGR
ncbi:uncharacterized protein LOC129617561 [Condylostylus longicornis]|uniref:uncharacterized protein LOC129617561 n=1 Tax=Condylostylus longicornis TaxID=2530218 RepID=UPI00244DA499|nr:uncharacterized protein LOC129617561 [Condylostylus longicornis]